MTQRSAENQLKNYQVKPPIFLNSPSSGLTFMPKLETTSIRFHYVPGTALLTSFHATLKYPKRKVQVVGVSKPKQTKSARQHAPACLSQAPSNFNPQYPEVHVQKEKEKKNLFFSWSRCADSWKFRGPHTRNLKTRISYSAPRLVLTGTLLTPCALEAIRRISLKSILVEEEDWASLSERSESAPYRGDQQQPNDLSGQPLSHPSSARPLPALSNAVCPPTFLQRPVSFQARRFPRESLA